MKSKAIKIAATAVVLALALGGLLYSTLREGTEYYKHVDEVMTDPAAWQGKRLQLHGFVVDKSICVKPDTLEYRFQVQNNGKVDPGRATPASCPTRSRTAPRSCSRAICRPDGFAVEPNGVMAKCPSKYEAGKAAGSAAARASPCLHSAPSSCSPASSSALCDRGLGRRRAAPLAAR